MAWITTTTILVGIFVIVSGQIQYSKDERAALNKFRPMVNHLLTQDFHQKDGYLLKYIRNNKGDLKKAAAAVEKVAQWRKDKNIDPILDENLVGHNKYLPAKVDGYDRMGRPVILLPFGKWQLRKYVVAGKRDDANRVYRWHLEKVQRRIFEVAEEKGQDIDEFYIIVDCDGYNVRESLCLGCVPLTLDMATSFDTGSGNFVKNLTLVNTPRIFQPVLQLVRQLFQLQSLVRMSDYPSDKDVWMPRLHEDVAPDQLPKSLGGTRQG